MLPTRTGLLRHTKISGSLTTPGTARLPKIRYQAAAFLLVPLQLFASSEPKAPEKREASQRCQCQCAKEPHDKRRFSLGKVLAENRRIAKTSDSQCGQQGHKPNCASQTALLTLSCRDLFIQLVTISGVSIKNELTQKNSFLFPVAHNRYATRRPVKSLNRTRITATTKKR
jgi:hypothetical protein